MEGSWEHKEGRGGFVEAAKFEYLLGQESQLRNS